MDSKKVFFIVLGVIAVLYFATLGTGVWLNEAGSGGQPKNPSAATDQWVGALGPILSAFAPALDLSGLECDGQPVGRVFKLQVEGNGRSDCEIAIPAADEDYRKTELSTVGSQVGIYVRGQFDPNRFDKKNKAANCFLDHERLPDGLRLEARYEPNDSDGGDGWECWLVQEPGKPLAITALGDGGTLRLTLRCDDCKDDPGCETPCQDKAHLVRLRMK